MAATARRVIEYLGSPYWMLAFFVFAAAAGLVSIRQPDWITALWIGPLGIFAVALLASIATRPRFRRDSALLGLHLALLCMVILFAGARLTYLDGTASLTEGGEPFDGRLAVDRRGPLHPEKIRYLRFANEATLEDYNSAEKWYGTLNRVRWWSLDGRTGIAEISNDRPLILDGYRIHPTFNRGYAPVFRWEPRSGEPMLGSVQLRADTQFGMANEWSLPNGEVLWIMLEPLQDGAVAIQPGQRRAGLGAAALAHHLVVRHNDVRTTIQVGESLEFADGRLVYVELRSWMGYRIIYDPSANWLAAAAAFAAACMIAYYWRILRTTSPLTETAQA